MLDRRLEPLKRSSHTQVTYIVNDAVEIANFWRRHSISSHRRILGHCLVSKQLTRRRSNPRFCGRLCVHVELKKWQLHLRDNRYNTMHVESKKLGASCLGANMKQPTCEEKLMPIYLWAFADCNRSYFAGLRWLRTNVRESFVLIPFSIQQRLLSSLHTLKREQRYRVTEQDFSRSVGRKKICSTRLYMSTDCIIFHSAM